MKYMSWSYDQLMACPASYLPVIAGIARQEAEDSDKARRRR